MASPVVVKPSTNRYLAAYLESLATRPLLTKSITGGVLSFSQELLATYLSGTPTKARTSALRLGQHSISEQKVQRSGIAPYDWLRANDRAFKLAIYGAFISAPLAHTLMGILQRVFAGQTSAKSKLLQIIASNVIISPITASVYLASLAVINGAKDPAAVIKFVRMALMSLLRITWITGPTAMAFAQRFLPAETWVPFFSLVAFVIGTHANTKAKKQHLAAIAKAQAKRDAERKSG